MRSGQAIILARSARTPSAIVSTPHQRSHGVYFCHALQYIVVGYYTCVSEFVDFDTGHGIAKKIVEAHGGTIWAESDVQDKGARFIVELPTIVS